MGASGRRATVDPERWLDPSGPYYQEDTTQQTQRYDELEGDDDEPLVRPHRQVMSPRVVGLDGRDDLKEANIDELRGLVTESEFRLIRELRRTIRNFEGTQQQGMSLSDLGQGLVVRRLKARLESRVDLQGFMERFEKICCATSGQNVLKDLLLE